MNTGNRSCIVTLVLAISAVPLSAATMAEGAHEATIDVAADKPGPAISPMLYGLMTEEINHSYDGGLYAELIRNRDFKEADKKDPTKPAWWSLVAPPNSEVKMTLDHENPVNTTGLPVSLKVEIKKVSGPDCAGVASEGFWGVPVQLSTNLVHAHPACTFHYGVAIEGGVVFRGTIL